MKLHLVFWIIVAVVVGLASFVVARPVALPGWLAGGPRDPVIDYPALLDFGEQEAGSVAVAPFTITNRGGQELLLDQVQTSCSCSGFEGEVGGEFRRVEALRLRPGGSRRMRIRLSVREGAGESTRTLISFRTNDPAHREASIEAVVSRVTGGITTFPNSLAFGTVIAGKTARETLEIRDGALRPRVIDRVTSTDPDRISPRLLRADTVVPSEGRLGLGTVLGHVEVVIHAREPGRLGGALRLHIRGEDRSIDVPVTGIVAAPVEAHPPSLMLPRASRQGPLYFGQCLCRTADGRPLAISVRSVPPCLTVRVSSVAGNQACQTIRVEWNSADRKKLNGTAHRYAIGLTARVGDEETQLEIPVNCLGGE